MGKHRIPCTSSQNGAPDAADSFPSIASPFDRNDIGHTRHHMIEIVAVVEPCPGIVRRKLHVIPFSHADSKDVRLQGRDGTTVRMAYGQDVACQLKIIDRRRGKGGMSLFSVVRLE